MDDKIKSIIVSGDGKNSISERCKSIATLTLLGFIKIEIPETAGFIKPTKEQIKNFEVFKLNWDYPLLSEWKNKIHI